ncbi:hypothetical protein [Terriglobus albidus]|uniref:hypothetical protein n=1 Tax=Terriglobus albidus TaxID=1592106 RepID=UPI0021E0040B|nr:hypothetical protein [Terriglobus albidus]
MSISQDAVASFFQNFAASSNSKDTPSEISHFANVFVAAGPAGSAVVKVEDFEKVLPKRRQLLEASGLVHTSLKSFDITAATDRHVVVNNTWEMDFETQTHGRVTIPVSATFTIDMATDTPKVLVYLAHQDILQILRDRSMLAGT